MPDPAEPFLNSLFRVEIDGLVTSDFTEVVLPEARTDIIEYRTGGDRTVRKVAGRSRFTNLILRRGLTESNELFRWWSQVITGEPARKNASVVLFDSSLQEVKRWNLFRVLPARYSLSPLVTTEVPLLETLECAVEHFEVA
jgi:phage tail-like protein